MTAPGRIPLEGAGLAVLSAVLFGASTPFAKVFVGSGVDPWLLAGLLYLGSGIGLAAFAAVSRLAGAPRGEAPLRRADLPWLALVVLFGGIAGPVLLMVGLATTPASSAALLLNLEGLATMAIAWLVFHEGVDRRLLLGAAAILAGSLVLAWQGGGQGGWGGAGIGAAAIAGACLAWGIDNNLTRKVSGADPVVITMVKGLVAGAVNVGLGLAVGAGLPGAGIVAAAAVVGLLGYGVSLVLFVLALRHLGSARTGAYFAMAPFVGAALGVAMFREPVTMNLMAAAALMAVGVALHLLERHDHPHVHAPMEHEHRHRHDIHHQHTHLPGDPPGEPHAHPHRHAAMAHAHPHAPDLHHRHRHSGAPPPSSTAAGGGDQT